MTIDSPAEANVLPAAATAAEPWPSPGRAWYAVFVFALSLMINFLDRAILGLLVPSIKADLQLSDLQMSVIMGFAFIAFYVILGLPVARYADVGVRRRLIGIGIGLWSAATALCGLAQNFWQLFACRVLTGVGESCNGPATFSMLADYFPREKLARAIAVMNFGFMMGTGIAFIIGGAVIAFLQSTPPVDLPLVGTLKSWQLTFIIIGLPGLIVAAMLWTVKEPVRRGRALGSTGKPKSMPLRDVFKFLYDNRMVYGPMMLGLAINTTHAIGVLGWAPAFYGRTYGWDMGTVGLVSGVILLVVWPLGSMFGAWLAEHWQKQGKDDANLRVVVWAILLLVPGQLAWPLMPTGELAMAVNALNGFIAAWVLGPQNAAIQVVTPNELRGQVSALGIFIVNVLGFGVGPTFVALVTVLIFGSEDQLRYGLASMALMGPPAALAIWWGMKPYAEALRRAREKWS
jgi:MFS family permease